MRLKIYSARTLPAAMERVRAELGDDAVIVHIDEPRSGPVRITAAIEDAPAPEPIEDAEAPPAPNAGRTTHHRFEIEQLEAVLRYHAVPAGLAQRLRSSAAQRDEPDALEALASALEDQVRLRPLNLTAGKPILLVGQPGQGKTLTIARLAAHAAVAGRKVRVITLDGSACGALEQINGFLQPLEIPVSAATLEELTPERLANQTGDELLLIDSAGVNPYALADVESLARCIARTRVEPIWVMAAGGCPLEAAEMAEVFASLSVKRMIITRLDAARRLGALLTAPVRSGLSLAAFSDSPYLADPLEPATPLALARRLLEKPDPAHVQRSVSSPLASQRAAS
jgi:flagellar biosynthesis protein FlhF